MNFKNYPANIIMVVESHIWKMPCCQPLNKTRQRSNRFYVQKAFFIMSVWSLHDFPFGIFAIWHNFNFTMFCTYLLRKSSKTFNSFELNVLFSQFIRIWFNPLQNFTLLAVSISRKHIYGSLHWSTVVL